MSWSKIWKGVERVDFDPERPPFAWTMYDKLLPGYNFKGKKVLEFGCGTGINSTIMAYRGAKVTMCDLSKEALDLARKNLDALGLDAELVHGDLFETNFKGYDLVHSEGLVEHFLPPKRQEIMDIHSRAVKKGGKLMIIVPHSKCPPYRAGKLMAEATRTWIYTNEFPYTKNELVSRMRMAGLKPGPVKGGETIFAMTFLFSPIMLQSSRMIRKGIKWHAGRRMIRLNYDNWLSNRWGRIIGCVGDK